MTQIINPVNVLNRPLLLSSAAVVSFLALTHLVSDAITSIFSALLPTLQYRFGLTETTLALLVATLSFSASVTQPLFGALADRLGQRQVGALGIILNGVLLSLIGVVPSVYLLFSLLFAGGLGSAALHPAGASMARKAVKQKSVLAVSLFSAGGTIGVALGPVIVLVLVSGLGLQFTPWLMIPAVIFGVLLFFIGPTNNRTVSAVSRPKLLIPELLTGPVGLLALAGILGSVAFITFSNGISLWLVHAHKLAYNDPLIGWTLSVFAISAAFGGIGAGLLSRRISQRLLIPSSMLIAIFPLFLIFSSEPGKGIFFMAVGLAGGLLHASLPLMVVSAQDLAPRSAGVASGMMMGFAGGTAGILYIGVGRLQELFGLEQAMRLSYLTLIPAAILAFYVLTKHQTTLKNADKNPVMLLSCLCSPGLSTNVNACPCRESSHPTQVDDHA